MKGVFQFLKATIAGGFFVVLPVVLVSMVVAETVGMLVDVATVVSEFLVGEGIEFLSDPQVVAVLILIAVCFLTGVAMQTRIGSAFGRFIERLVLDPLPGYRVMKTLTQSIGGFDTSSAFTPAIMDAGDGTRAPVLAVEEHRNGDVTVLIPMAPTPTVGPIRVVSGDRVHRVDVSLTEFMDCYFNFGSGTKELMAGGVVSSVHPPRGGSRR